MNTTSMLPPVGNSQRPESVGGETPNRAPRFELWTVTFVLSAGMLAYEILLTRIASVLLTSSHLFFVLGLALLGLAAGAIAEYFLALRPEKFARVTPGLWLTGNAAMLALAIMALVKLGPGGGLLVIALAAALPFAVAGLILSRFFRLFPELTGNLYGADLLGAAVGALIVPASLTNLGPVESILLYADVQAFLGAVFIMVRGIDRRLWTATGVALFAGGLFAFNWHNALLGPIPVGHSLDKDLYRLSSSGALGKTKFVDSRWSTFGRTDLVRFSNEPGSMSIFVDGAAGTPMFQFDGNLGTNSATMENVNHGFAGALPLAFLKPDQKHNALDIGPGGGRDVLLLLQAGFKHITAVDINPQTIQIVKDHSHYDGGIYSMFPNVKVVNDEGRRFLRASKDHYDLITLFMPITKSSSSLNAFALSSSFLYTRQAFTDYYRHLTDKGVLFVMAHQMPEAVKLTTTAVAALEAQGLSQRQAMKHIYILGSHMMPFFLLAKTPLDAEQTAEFHALAHTPMFDSQFSYIPGVKQVWYPSPESASGQGDVPMMNPMLYNLADGSLSLAQVESGMGLNLIPATDDRPFFSQFGLGPPGLVLAMFWVSLAALLAAIFIPANQLRPRSTDLTRRPDLWLPLWFAGIGMGYIALELVLFQKLYFYLGDPSRSLAVLLASLLAGSGIGSLISMRARTRAAVLAGVATVVLAASIALLLPLIFPALRDSTLAAKLAIASALLIVQGVPMGLMFPIGLRVAGETFGPTAVPWMWAINGAASVFGSAVAIFVAMLTGYTGSLVIGVGCYALAATAVWFLTRSDAAPGERSASEGRQETSVPVHHRDPLHRRLGGGGRG